MGYRNLALAGLAFALSASGVYVGKRLAQRQPEPVAATAPSSDSYERALSEGRLALKDLNSDGSKELVYFPRAGPPEIFTKVGESYSANNPMSQQLSRAVAQFESILAGDASELTKTAQLRELEAGLSSELRRLVAYTAVQDRVRAGSLDPGYAQALLRELYSTSPADLVLGLSGLPTGGLATIASMLGSSDKSIYTSGLGQVVADPALPGWFRDANGNLWPASTIERQYEEHKALTQQGAVKTPGGWVITEDELRRQSDQAQRQREQQRAAHQPQPAQQPYHQVQTDINRAVQDAGKAVDNFFKSFGQQQNQNKR